MDLVHLPLKTSKQRGDECHMIGKGVYAHADEPLLAKKVVSLQQYSKNGFMLPWL